MNRATITIDPEFRDLLPEPSAEERAHLERSLIHEGCRDPLVVWNGILLDGHNRYEICQREKLVFTTREVQLADRQCAELWIIANQLGRRNLHPNHYAYYLGKRYEVEKKKEGRPEKLRQNDEVKSSETRKRLAEETGTSPKTVERNAEFARGVDVMEAAVPGSRAKVLNGEHQLTKGEVQKIAKLAKAEPEKVKAVIQEEKEKPGEVEKMLRAAERQEYPWMDCEVLEVVLEGIKKLQALPKERLAEFLKGTPSGRYLLKETNFKEVAQDFEEIAEWLEEQQ